jgi:uncharacterized protein YqhQ
VTHKVKIKVGGQAVMEGVMMRSPKSFAVAVRKQNGEILLKESPWHSIGERYPLLRWPVFRGSVVLIESLVNGISALNFSAKTVLEAAANASPDQTPKNPDTDDKLDWAVWGTVVVALAFGIGLFVALPHVAVWAGSQMAGQELTVRDLRFHIIVGVVKLLVFLGYLALISLMQDVRRLFMYHGAEHQSIYTYEAGEPLTVEYARKHSPLHPRCGTTFLLLVITLSIVMFSMVFPPLLWLLGEPTSIGWLNQLIYIIIKLPLMLPLAGVAYEFQRFFSNHMDRACVRALSWPGMLVQRLTTRPPTDDQLEVALTSLRKTLWRENIGSDKGAPTVGQTTTFPNFEAVVAELGEGY